MRGEIFDVNGNILSRVDVENGAGGSKIHLTVEQNCDDLISRCTAARSLDKLRGHRKTSAFRCVAELPVALVEVFRSQGVDLLTDDDALRKVLNDPAFRAFRTTEGRV